MVCAPLIIGVRSLVSQNLCSEFELLAAVYRSAEGPGAESAPKSAPRSAFGLLDAQKKHSKGTPRSTFGHSEPGGNKRHSLDHSSGHFPPRGLWHSCK